MFLTTPFMVAVQIVSARIGSMTGRGLAANLKEVLPPWLLYAVVALVAAANIFNIAADIAAIGEAVRLVAAGRADYALLLGVGCLVAQFDPVSAVRPMHGGADPGVVRLCRRGVSVHIGWGKVLASTFIPRVTWDHDFILMLVTVLGTHQSVFVLLAVRSRSRNAGSRSARRKLRCRAARDQQPRVSSRSFSTWVGMVLSNVVGFFIIVTTAATLHADHVNNIGTAAEAAEALRPLAGSLAFFLFSLGIVGTGLLAIPALAGAAAYAIGETLGWKSSLGLRLGRARGFYLIVGGATLIGSLGAMSPVNPITMLVWSAVVNGVVAVPLMVGMMMVITNRAIMGKFAASRVLATLGWLATLLMGLVVAALLFTTVTG